MEEEGTTMVTLIAFAAVVIGLLALTGLPYPQSWQSRWGTDDR